MPKQRRFLKHNAERPTIGGAELRGVLPHIITEREVTVGEPLEPGGTPQQRGLAAAGRTEERREPTRLRLEGRIEHERAELATKACADRTVAVHCPARRKLFSSNIIARMTQKEKTNMPAARIWAGVHCSVST